jgi:hypothetical protein
VWDVDARTFTAFDESGAPTQTRPFTAAEKARADADLGAEVAEANVSDRLARIDAAIAQLDGFAAQAFARENAARNTAALRTGTTWNQAQRVACWTLSPTSAMWSGCCATT